MNLPFRVVLVLLSTNIYSQSIQNSFLTEANRSNYIKRGSLLSTSDIVQEIQSNKKVIVSYKVMNFDRDLLFAPVIAAKIKISWNLSLVGRMSAYNSQERLVQSYGWGLTIKPGKQLDNSPWNFSFNSGTYRSYQKVTSSSVTTSIYRSINISKINCIIGYSASEIKATDYSQSGFEKKHSLKETISLLSIGTMLSYKSINIVPKLSFGSNLFTSSVELQRQF